MKAKRSRDVPSPGRRGAHGQTPVGELVGRAAAGDEAAWECLVRRFSDLVGSVARAHRLSPADVADVAQTCWLRLMENLGRLREPERVGAWLATTARRECLAVLRRSRREIPTVPRLDLAGATAPADGGVLAAERSRVLRDAIATLAPPAPAMFGVLLRDGASSYDDVVRELGMAKGSIGPTRARAIEQLGRKLAMAGHGTGDEAWS